MHFPAIQIISFPKIQIKDGSRQVRAKKAKGDGNKPSHLCKADFGILLEILLAKGEVQRRKKSSEKSTRSNSSRNAKKNLSPHPLGPTLFFLL